jgi:peroxiredoxin
MKKTIFLLPVFTVVVMLCSYTSPSEGYKVGDKASDFKLKNVDGKMVSMADNPAAKGYIIVFTCNTCPFAQAYEDRIISLHKNYASKGYPVIAINTNDPDLSPGDSFENMKARASSKKYPFAYLLDESQEVARTYGASRTPHVFIVSKKDDAFTIDYIGTIDDNAEDADEVKKKYVEEAMADILAGKPANVNYTKAIGCGIKWRRV